MLEALADGEVEVAPEGLVRNAGVDGFCAGFVCQGADDIGGLAAPQHQRSACGCEIVAQ